MKRSRFSEEQIIGILKEHKAGIPVAEFCRKHGVSDASIYKWKAKFGGMEVSPLGGASLFCRAMNANGFIESFNGRLRHELLNETQFSSLFPARESLIQWRLDYHGNRPHSQINWQTPNEFASTFTRQWALARHRMKAPRHSPSYQPHMKAPSTPEVNSTLGTKCGQGQPGRLFEPAPLALLSCNHRMFCLSSKMGLVIQDKFAAIYLAIRQNPSAILEKQHPCTTSSVCWLGSKALRHATYPGATYVARLLLCFQVNFDSGNRDFSIMSLCVV